MNKIYQDFVATKSLRKLRKDLQFGELSLTNKDKEHIQAIATFFRQNPEKYLTTHFIISVRPHWKRSHLQKSIRSFRYYNDAFSPTYFLISNSKGYKFTCNKSEIKKYRDKLIQQNSMRNEHIYQCTKILELITSQYAPKNEIEKLRKNKENQNEQKK